MKRQKNRSGQRAGSLVLMCLLSASVVADGSMIDKVYDPDVQLLETELEYRLMLANGPKDTSDSWRHKLGLGRSLSDDFFVEGYLIGVEGADEAFEVTSFEVELKWQLTEPGEYRHDWGLLFELENAIDHANREAKSTLLALHEWPRWVGMVNVALIYEWGDAMDAEWETVFSSQMRYRYHRSFEPAVEWYIGQDTVGFGPVLTGAHRVAPGKNLHWEAGVICGLDSVTPDSTWKLNLEYEF
jgi:hypothetical protein